MGQKDKEVGRMELSRRDFLKVSAAGAGAIAALDFAPAPAMANIRTDGNEATTTYVSTCPYCSAQCGQKVVVGNTTHKVYDIYGDNNSPTNRGGLCAKGAGAFQLVNNVRRLGVPEHTPSAINGDGKDMTGTAWRRRGNKAWQEIPLATAMHDIAEGATFNDPDSLPVTHKGLVQIRNEGMSSNDGGVTNAAWTGAPGENATAVQFFGCSHMNNEQNYLYRKLVATFGTSRVEHQARI
jgi:anaerobic selenocysteine-containing dehydrogenase